jgi:hypothetical protein
MRFNRQGVTRIVLLTKNYAIKFPRVNYGWKKFIEGICCNLSENECWTVSKSEWLCPVLFSWAGFVLVMPRLEILKDDNDIPEIHLGSEGSDIHACNYGYYKDKIVCVDYPYHRIKPYKR